MEPVMAGSAARPEFRQRMERLETLIQELERLPDPRAQARTREIIQSILELHGTALERIFETIAADGATGLALIDSLARDDLVGSVLLLHGLHPQDLPTRVLRALDQVRPYLRSHGGDVELLGIAEGVVRLRMQGSCQGCPSSAVTLKLAIEAAIYERAPDATGIWVEGVVEPSPGPTSAFIAVDQLLRNDGGAAPPTPEAQVFPPRRVC
jgi:Fe-S cluster biogenesis protein NfuA